MRKVANISTRKFETMLVLFAPDADVKNIIGKETNGSMNVRVVGNVPLYEVEL